MPETDELPTTIQMRNPHVIRIVREQIDRGTGRSFAETAENMILADAERRRADQGKPTKRRREKQTA